MAYDIGLKMLKYSNQRKEICYIELCSIFFINSEAMSFITDTDTDFITTDFVRPENQDAKVAQILWMGAVTANNRRKLGVMDSILATITA